jgi:hypothetical protein
MRPLKRMLPLPETNGFSSDPTISCLAERQNDGVHAAEAYLAFDTKGTFANFWPAVGCSRANYKTCMSHWSVPAPQASGCIRTDCRC